MSNSEFDNDEIELMQKSQTELYFEGTYKRPKVEVVNDEIEEFPRNPTQSETWILSTASLLTVPCRQPRIDPARRAVTKTPVQGHCGFDGDDDIETYQLTSVANILEDNFDTTSSSSSSGLLDLGPIL
ncbi:hypothetical protein EC957_004427 [Mortierella hygrophila]|uniref:Uncharacterized protein n=1 Tax=Mortierella hygrophila TaxID=979708 RepID=A0A9P6K0L0_9FUNG|nr:hypothetical protein EC957_004427 [Mortierella hygrophila]